MAEETTTSNNQRPNTVIAIVREVLNKVKTMLVDSNGTAFGTAANPVYTIDLANGNTTSGSGAPSSTPAKIGNLYVDTTTPNLYYAKGTSSSSDWVAL